MCDLCGRSSLDCPCPDLGSGADWILRRERFYASALGPPREPAVYHWDDDRDPHVDVYAFSGRRDEVLITGGLADRPMPGLRAGGNHPRRVELLVRTARIENWLPPVLREIAALPFREGEALMATRFVRGSGPIRPGCALRHVLLLPATNAEGLAGFLVEGEEVEFLRCVFLTDSEFRFGRERGVGPLARRLAAAGCLELLSAERAPVL